VLQSYVTLVEKFSYSSMLLAAMGEQGITYKWTSRVNNDIDVDFDHVAYVFGDFKLLFTTIAQRGIDLTYITPFILATR